ncbi:hypothetical protein GcM1_032002 [Golovinomyces cichoracearum]|uniref:Uncharacterized protein n=1 Tax=Golovinomyces cichoracearum TaxID=62708 RepID=A0A420JCN2_9PEZI|nr:hypothetical protein GcM1_032002 [Golovinomyces cichoracearum]
MNKALEAVVCDYRPKTLLVDISYHTLHAYDSNSLLMRSEPLKVSLDAEDSVWNPPQKRPPPRLDGLVCI